MKKLLTIILSLILILSLTGCSKEALAGYTDALELTNSIESGKKNIDFTMDMDFNIENLNADQVQEIKKLEHIKFSLEILYDKTADNKMIAKLNFGVAGMSIDATIYREGDKVYMYVPVLGGYVDLSAYAASDKKADLEQGSQILKLFSDKWKDLLTQEDVMKNNNTYIQTDDGQIKTKVYSVNMNDTQIKELMKAVSPDLIDFLISNGQISSSDNLNKDQLISKINKVLESITIDNFSTVANVDFDGRLVKQDTQIKLGFPDAKQAQPESISIGLTITNSGLGEKQDMEFPKIADNEWLSGDIGSLLMQKLGQ